MAGLMTRQEVRDRILAVMRGALDKYVPLDPNKPIKDGLFYEWEELADEFDREVTGAFVESLCDLSEHAALAHPGACPYCHSGQVRWLRADGQQERRSNHGLVVLPRQTAQCRSCGRSFSPSRAGVEPEPLDRSDAQGVGEGVP